MLVESKSDFMHYLKNSVYEYLREQCIKERPIAFRVEPVKGNRELIYTSFCIGNNRRMMMVFHVIREIDPMERGLIFNLTRTEVRQYSYELGDNGVMRAHVETVLN